MIIHHHNIIHGSIYSAENTDSKERKKRKLKYIWNLQDMVLCVGRVLEFISYDPYFLSLFFMGDENEAGMVSLVFSTRQEFKCSRRA